MDEAYYKQQFFTESRELLDSVSDALLTLEASPSLGEPLNAIFRSIHTIKGSAGVFALNDLSGFAHHMENVLNKACEGKIQVTPELVDMLFQSVDALNAMLDACQREEPFPDYHELAEAFQNVAVPHDEQTPTPASSAHPEPSQEVSPPQQPALPLVPEKHLLLSSQAMPDGFRAIVRAKAAQGYTPYLVRLHFTDDMLENGYDPLVLLKNLREASVAWYADSSRTRTPKLEFYEPLRLYLDVTVFLCSSRTEAELKDLAFDEDLLDVKKLDVDGEVSDAVDTQCLRDFLETDSFLVEQIESTALEFERTRSPETLNALFRSVHTLKGDASYVGLKKLGVFAHEMEALLDKLRNDSSLCTQSTMDTILHGVDRLKGAIEKLSRGEVDLELGQIETSEVAVADAEAGEMPGKKDTPVLAPEVSKVFIFQLVQHKKVLETLCGVDVPKEPEMLERVRRVAKGLASAAVFIGLNELTRLVTALRQALEQGENEPYGRAYNALLGWIDEMTGEPQRLGEILIGTGKVTPQDLKSALEQQKPLGEILVEEGKLDPNLLTEALKKQTLMREASKMQEGTTQQPTGTTPTQGSATEIRVMRVDEEKIDTLSNMIGELVVAKNAYDYLLTRLLIEHELPPSVIKSFKDNLYLFSRLTSELQQGLLSVRMIPIRGVFHKYSRVVRDIARKQDKLIDFITEGEETEIDKKVADTLSEPLIHMVRNACDHGIETPSERRAAGKPEKGTVRLRAYQEGSRLYVQVIDDGKGMDRIRVFEKALERGLPVISPDDDRLLDVIFEPGFSMKDEVTDISGRGVGMDAVRSSVLSLGGSVSFRSVEGKGSTFTLELPMTMGISAALVVLAEGRQYALPLDRVVETIRITPDRIRTFHDRKGVHYRGEVLPIERLDTLLYQLEHSGDPRELFQEHGLFSLFDPSQEIDIVVLATPRGKYGIVVDGFTRNVDIAIRPVPDVLKDIAVLSGVSILGDGKVLLVLNPDQLV